VAVATAPFGASGLSARILSGSSISMSELGQKFHPSSARSCIWRRYRRQDLSRFDRGLPDSRATGARIWLNRRRFDWLAGTAWRAYAVLAVALARNGRAIGTCSLRFHRIYAPLGLSSMRSRRARIFGHRRTNLRALSHACFSVLRQGSREFSDERLHEERTARRHNVHLHPKRFKL